MGGYIAFEFVQRHASQLASLILCHTRAEADTPEGARAREMSAREVLREGVAELAAAMPQKLLSSQTYQQSPDKMETCRSWIADQRPTTIAAAQRAMATRRDMTSSLSAVRVPTLVVAGEQDTITPPAGMQAMSDQLPQSRYVCLPQTGHLSPLEQPLELSRAISDFLSHPTP